MSISAVKHLLSSPVAYHPILARALGSVPAAVMLSQGIYWQNKSEQEGGTTFFLTAEEWFNQTGVTEDAQKTARRVLGKAGFWHEKLMGMPARMHYRIDVDALVAVIDKYLKTATPVAVDYRNKKREKPRTSSGKFRQQVAVNYGNKETIENKERLIRESARAENEPKTIDLEAEKNKTSQVAPAPPQPAAGRRANTSDEAENLIRAWANGDGKETVLNWIAETTFSEKVHGRVRDEITKFVGHYAVSEKPGVSHKMFADPVLFFQNRFKAWLVQAKELNRPTNKQQAAAAATYEPPRRILN